MRLVSLSLSTLIALSASADVSIPAIPLSRLDPGMLAIVPEPGTGLLLIAGLLGVGIWRRRRD